LYDHSVVASLTEKHISNKLAVCTLQKALNSQREIILYDN